MPQRLKPDRCAKFILAVAPKITEFDGMLTIATNPVAAQAVDRSAHRDEDRDEGNVGQESVFACPAGAFTRVGALCPAG